ncbi:hypothetical protein AB0Q95_29745 [Streptomyces sp. NPDC059900]|uniref:hypothetical protein n=1 Tax=Streptomyces sp. NPDC059900 TaxID=3155816 RepID=UPI0034231936
MLEEDWGDDAGYRRAVGCTWVMVVFALLCCLLVVVLVTAAAFGAGIVLHLIRALNG